MFFIKFTIALTNHSGLFTRHLAVGPRITGRSERSRDRLGLVTELQLTFTDLSLSL